MAKFGKNSLENLDTCHEDLKKILNIAIQYVDFTVTAGHRNKEKQDLFFEQGYSKLKYPNSKHNKYPSLAVDIVPYNNGIDYKNLDRYKNIVFFIKGIAYSLGIEVRLGCDWDNDFETTDHRFVDLPHIELKRKLIDGNWIKYE